MNRFGRGVVESGVDQKPVTDRSCNTGIPEVIRTPGLARPQKLWVRLLPAILPHRIPAHPDAVSVVAAGRGGRPPQASRSSSAAPEPDSPAGPNADPAVRTDVPRNSVPAHSGPARVLWPRERGRWLITADHGNAEMMIDPVTHGPHTYHTTNPVPLILVDDSSARLRQGGALQDIAPTILGVLGEGQPKDMTGRDLRLK